jgi:hypothetical protein
MYKTEFKKACRYRDKKERRAVEMKHKHPQRVPMLRSGLSSPWVALHSENVCILFKFQTEVLKIAYYYFCLFKVLATCAAYCNI